MSNYDAVYYENNGSGGDRIALRWYAQLIEKHAPPGRALDFGSGPGWMVRRMGMTRSCDGVEISEYSRQACKSLNPHAGVFGSTGEIPDGRYAAVSAIHVLEHITEAEVATTLREIRRILVPRGVLLMVTPDSDGRASRIRGGQWRALTDPTHINLQGHSFWRRSLISAGFEILQEGSDGLWDPPYTNWLVDRLRLPRIAVDVLRGGLTIRPGQGESYVAVARRTADD